MKLDRITILSATVLTFAFIAMLIATGDGWGQIDLDISDPFSKIAAALSSLFIVSVLLERTLDIVIGIAVGNSDVKQRSAYRNALTLAKASAEVIGASHRPFVHNLQKTRLALDKERHQKKRLRLSIGFLVAVLLSVAGFQILSNFVDSVPSGLQGQLFIFLDIFLTAGLLTGGSQGIAEVIEIFRLRQDHTRSALDASKIVSDNNRLGLNKELKIAGIVTETYQGNTSSSNTHNQVQPAGAGQTIIGTADLTWLSGGVISLPQSTKPTHPSSVNAPNENTEPVDK